MFTRTILSKVFNYHNNGCCKYLSRTISNISSKSAKLTTPVVAFDIDGVLIRGREVISGAKEAMHRITSKVNGGSGEFEIPYIFITNGGGRTEQEKAAQLSDWLDLKINATQVCLAHSPMQDLVTKYGNKTIMVIGYTNVASVAKNYGFKSVIT